MILEEWKFRKYNLIRELVYLYHRNDDDFLRKMRKKKQKIEEELKKKHGKWWLLKLSLSEIEELINERIKEKEEYMSIAYLKDLALKLKEYKKTYTPNLMKCEMKEVESVLKKIEYFIKIREDWETKYPIKQRTSKPDINEPNKRRFG